MAWYGSKNWKFNVKAPNLIFGSDLKAWLKTDDATKRTITTGAFQALTDQLSASSVSQGTASNRPALVEGAGPRSQDIARFTAANVHSLVDQAGTYPTLTQPFWAAGIIKPTAAAAASGRRNILYSITGNAAIRVNDSERLDMFAGGTSLVSGDVIDAAWHYFIAQYNGASSWLVIDGGAKIEGSDVGAAGFTQMTIGSGGGFGAGDSYTGDLLEIQMGTGMTDARLAQLKTYLTSRM